MTYNINFVIVILTFLVFLIVPLSEKRLPKKVIITYILSSLLSCFAVFLRWIQPYFRNDEEIISNLFFFFTMIAIFVFLLGSLYVALKGYIQKKS